MATATNDLGYMAEARRPSHFSVPEKDIRKGSAVVDSDQSLSDNDISNRGNRDNDAEPEPTDEEMRTLRRVSGKIPWMAYTVAFVELCERFSWYGTTIVFVNFIQQPLPHGSSTGNIQQNERCYNFQGIGGGKETCNQPGALNQGQQASTGLTTFNQFWAYLMPLLGGYIADEYLGRIATIQGAIACALIGHIILVISSIPSVITNSSGALGAFAVGLVILGLGTGGFKSNIAPLLGEQIKQKRPFVVTLPSGERVVKDPAVTVARVFLYFYMMINIGSLVGQIGMVYAERYVGYWLSYALPTFLFILCPLVIWFCKKRYILSPPTGSVTSRAFKLLFLASKGCWTANPVTTYKNLTRDGFWNAVKPSNLGSARPAWMHNIDDVWVEQVARGFNACKVFFWLPLYWLAYGQITNNLTSQAATLELNGVPNDIVSNLNPISLVVFIPLVDMFLYPALRKYHIRFTPLKRIATGFMLGSAAMVSAAVIQHYIYKTSPCDRHIVNTGSNCAAPISVWVQTVPYVLIGLSEIMASITSLEYAFGKAPENMRGLVMGVNLLQTAFSSAISQAFLPLVKDPNLTWNYTVVAVLAFLGGVGFWLTWRSLDAREDELNLIQETKYKGRSASIDPTREDPTHNPAMQSDMEKAAYERTGDEKKAFA